MNLSLRQLKVFLGVAESSSFTKTAQRLHLSQAALSAIIRELESQLQCRLLDRTTRTVALTEAGRVFVHTATHIVQVLENSALEVAKISREQRRLLRIGVTPHIAVSMMPTILKRFAQSHPEVLVEVSDSPPEVLLRSVESGTLDAAYGAFFGKTSGIQRTLVFPTYLVLVSSAGAQRDLGRSPVGGVTWKALQDAPLICFHSENLIQRLIEGNLAKACISPGKRTVVSHLETAISMAEAGFGLAVVPSISAATCERYNVRLDKIEPLVELSFDCITQAGRGNMEILDQFSQVIEQVAKHFEKTAGPGPRKPSRKKETAPAAG
jgi:DNA-binding transcriptional LysR family regulator